MAELKTHSKEIGNGLGWKDKERAMVGKNVGSILYEMNGTIPDGGLKDLVQAAVEMLKTWVKISELVDSESEQWGQYSPKIQEAQARVAEAGVETMWELYTLETAAKLLREDWKQPTRIFNDKKHGFQEKFVKFEVAAKCAQNEADSFWSIAQTERQLWAGVFRGHTE